MVSSDLKTTLEKKEKFLLKLSETCNVGESAEFAGIDRSTIYRWRDESPEFAELVQLAKKRAVEALEDEAHRRAFNGVLRIGKQGNYIEYSDTLAIFLLKAHDPERYKDRVHSEVEGKGGFAINVLTGVPDVKSLAPPAPPKDDYSDIA